MFDIHDLRVGRSILHRATFAAACGALLFVVRSAGAQSPTVNVTITDLGALGTRDSSIARAMNSSGQVVGVTFTSTLVSSANTDDTRAFLWQNGTMTDLGGSRSDPAAINDHGQVVGESEIGGIFHAVLWQNGTMTDLGVLPGDHDSDALAINNVGQVVGWSSRSDGRLHAFLWQNGTMTDLGSLGGRDSYVFPTAINDVGQVVGLMAAITGGADGHAFLWQNGTMTDLGTLGGAFSQPSAINSVGQIVGYSETTPGGSLHAFLWDSNTMTDLGAFPGADAGPYPVSLAEAINNVGQVVGWSSDASGIPHPFLWKNGTMLNLDPLGGGGDAGAINDAGQIVGGTNTDQGGRAYLWQNGTRTYLDPVGGILDQSGAFGINSAGQVIGNSYPANDTPQNLFHATLWTVTTNNTPIGTNVPVSPALGFPVSVILPVVTIPGNTTATSVALPPPSGFTIDGLIWDIATTATYTPPVTICLPYHSTTNPHPHLYHYTGGAWVDITTGFVPVTQIVCGTAMSLSPFAVLVPSTVPFASFTARVEISRSHTIKKNGGDAFEIEGRGVLNVASNGIAPNVENVTVKVGDLSLAIPAGSFVKKADKDDDHGKKDRDDRVTTYNFKGVIAGVTVSAEIEQGPKHTFRFQFEGQHANFGVVSNPITVGLAIGDDVGQTVVKPDIDK